MRLNKIAVSDLLKKIPKELLEDIARETKVDWNVSRLRGEVMLDLLLFGLIRSERLSTRVLEELYNSSFFDCFFSKDKKHKTRHSSIADRMTKIPSAYFKSIFEWAWQHYSKQLSPARQLANIHRFDSTMIKISSAFVDWGMKVGRAPKEGYQKLQLKVTVGMKGLLPSTVKTFFDQKHLGEEVALYEAIIAASPNKNDLVVFDRGLKSRKKLKKLDLQDIKFVTRGSQSTRYEVIRRHEDPSKYSNENVRFIQDSVVHLYASSNTKIKHEFRFVEIEIIETGKKIGFITNIFDLGADQIAEIYRMRWDIEVFFRFLKQELNIKHLLSHSQNGIQVQIYVTLLLAILLTVYKQANKISGYKIAKIRFEEKLLMHLAGILYNYQNDS